MANRCALVVTSLLCLAGCGCAGAPAGPASAERGSPMKIEIELPRARFLAGEAMPLAVAITNRGRKTVEVPDPAANPNAQPVYHLKGPACPEGRSFSFRSAVFGDADGGGLPPMTAPLAPGEAHRAEVPFEQLAGPLPPGSYVLFASLDWAGMQARSEPLTFEIAPPRFHGFHLLADPGLQAPFPICVFCLEGEGEGRSVYLACFGEDATTQQVQFRYLARYVAAVAGAGAVFGPWRNCAGVGVPSPRAVWVAGETVAVADYGAETPLTLSFAGAPRVVRPALMTESGELDLFVLGGDGRELSLARFPPVGDSARPAVLWRQALPAAVSCARAALGPASGGSRRAALLVCGGGQGSRALLVEAPANGGTPLLRAVELGARAVLPASEPALAVAEDGSALGAVLLAEPVRPGQPRSLTLARLSWPADPARPGACEAAPAASLEEPVRSAAAAFALAGDTRRCEWVAVLAGGRAASSLSGGVARPLRRTPVVPIELLVMESRSHILTMGPDQSLSFEPLF